MRRRVPAFSNEETCITVNTPLPALNLPDGVTCWTGAALERQWHIATTGETVSQTPSPGASVAHRGPDDSKDSDSALRSVKMLYQSINILGLQSQRVQGIGSVLTSVRRLREEPLFCMYLLVSEGHAAGMLKVGVKKLFLEHPRTHALVEVDPLCILDFYVLEACQRRGFGRMLLQAMLRDQSERPGKRSLVSMAHVAIDRPSAKFLALLRKYYGCETPRVQVNNFVVFDRFFEGTTVTERGQLLRRSSTTESNNHNSNKNTNHTNDCSSGSSCSNPQQPMQTDGSHASVNGLSSVNDSNGSRRTTDTLAHIPTRQQNTTRYSEAVSLSNNTLGQTHDSDDRRRESSHEKTSSHSAVSSSVVPPASSFSARPDMTSTSAAAPAGSHTPPPTSHLSTCSGQSHVSLCDERVRHLLQPSRDETHPASSSNNSSSQNKQGRLLRCPL